MNKIYLQNPLVFVPKSKSINEMFEKQEMQSIENFMTDVSGQIMEDIKKKRGLEMDNLGACLPIIEIDSMSLQMYSNFIDPSDEEKPFIHEELVAMKEFMENQHVNIDYFTGNTFLSTESKEIIKSLDLLDYVLTVNIFMDYIHLFHASGVYTEDLFENKFEKLSKKEGLELLIGGAILIPCDNIKVVEYLQNLYTKICKVVAEASYYYLFEHDKSHKSMSENQKYKTLIDSVFAKYPIEFETEQAIFDYRNVHITDIPNTII